MIFITNDSIFEAHNWKIGDGKLILENNEYKLKGLSPINIEGKVFFENIAEVISEQLKNHSSYIDLKKLEMIDFDGNE